MAIIRKEMNHVYDATALPRMAAIQEPEGIYVQMPQLWRRERDLLR